MVLRKLEFASYIVAAVFAFMLPCVLHDVFYGPAGMYHWPKQEGVSVNTSEIENVRYESGGGNDTALIMDGTIDDVVVDPVTGDKVFTNPATGQVVSFEAGVTLVFAANTLGNDQTLPITVVSNNGQPITQLAVGTVVPATAGVVSIVINPVGPDTALFTPAATFLGEVTITFTAKNARNKTITSQSLIITVTGPAAQSLVASGGTPVDK